MPGLLKSRPMQLIVLGAILGFAHDSTADLVQFEIAGGAARLITLESVLKDEVAFVPLQGLVEQAGGSYNVLPTRLRVDLGGSTAWLRTGESRVHALSIFSLAQPIAEDESGALIALTDVPDFFLKSFRVTVRPFGGQPAIGAAPPASEPIEAGISTSVTPESSAESAAQQPIGSRVGRPGAVTAVLIDAGHGGYDTGLLSSGKIAENKITLEIAARVKSLLESAGGPAVILTRSEDVEVSPQQRERTAQAAPGAIFVSIHAGSSLSAEAEGIAVYFHAPPSGAGVSRADAVLAEESRRLAELVAASTAASAAAPLRGIIQAPLQLLSDLQIPAIEVEVGCLTSAADAQRLATDEYLGQISAGIFDGITAYLSGSAAPATPIVPAAPEVN